MNFEYIKQIEEKVDADFESNPLLQLPFCLIYNLFGQLVTRHLLDFGGVPVSYITPFYFIFERITDFTPLSLDEVDCVRDKIPLEQFSQLQQCANLNIVFPLVHRGLYSLKFINSEESGIEYSSSEAQRLECKDVIITNACLPAIHPAPPPSRDFVEMVYRRIKRDERLNILRFKKAIADRYESVTKSFFEEPLVPDDFYVQIGFSSAAAFKNIRNAYCAICRVYLDAVYCVDKYIARNGMYNSSRADNIWSGLGLEMVEYILLEDAVVGLCQEARADYGKFAEFFFVKGANGCNIKNTFMPPFWQIDSKVYFVPSVVPMLLGTRNLLISIQNNKAKNALYKYDENISYMFEPMLLATAQSYFEKAGFRVRIDKRTKNGQIDMLVYCAQSNTVLTIQAKATLPPESARMVDRLEQRIIEGIEQTLDFDRFDLEYKNAIFSACFDGIQSNPNHIRGILVNSSFGSINSWRKIEEASILTINIDILRHVLAECKVLGEFGVVIENYVRNLVEVARPVLTEKTFKLSNHTIHQRHCDMVGEADLLKRTKWL